MEKPLKHAKEKTDEREKIMTAYTRPRHQKRKLTKRNQKKKLIRNNNTAN